MNADEYVPDEEDVREGYALAPFEDELPDYGDEFLGQTADDRRAAWSRWLAAHDARVRRDAQREAAQMVRDACDRWEADGDDERLVNDVLDPWTSRVLNTEPFTWTETEDARRLQSIADGAADHYPEETP